MGNDISPKGRSNTYVRNATGKRIRVFYKKDEMKLDNIVTYGLGGLKTFNRYTTYTFLRIQPNDYGRFAGEGQLYVSVFVEGSGDDECGDQISLNYPIPSDRSFIVTSNEGIKLQKYGAGLCVGDDGRNYC